MYIEHIVDSQAAEEIRTGDATLKVAFEQLCIDTQYPHAEEGARSLAYLIATMVGGCSNDWLKAARAAHQAHRDAVRATNRNAWLTDRKLKEHNAAC